MKIKLLFILILTLAIYVLADDDEFLRDLPGNELLDQLTPEQFPTMDAIIILKEQSFMISPTEIDYKGITLTGPKTVFTKVMIVKLFNELAVKRYGSFEYEYNEHFGDEIPNGFKAKARVLKENGDIIVMDEDEVQNVVSRENSRGEPLSRKVLFKVPNLTAGDVLQIEYQFVDVFARSYSGIFYYNDRDFTLFSNLYLTFPLKEEFTITNLPKESIGEPQMQQASEEFGSGDTYYWSLRNLNEMPVEDYSLPFEDRSMITAFALDKIWGRGSNRLNTWNGLGSGFYEEYVNKGGISNSEIESLGCKPELDGTCTLQNVDELYTSIRKYFKLNKANSLYPLNEDISDLFGTKKGDASDLAIIMYKILKEEWEQDCKCVMIRDKREGIYEKTIPSPIWFDRLGILVNINGEEKLYDFDRCISTNYTMPWYLNDTEVLVIDDKGSYHKKLGSFTDMETNFENEKHKIYFDANYHLKDTLLLQYKGCFEENLRRKFYDAEQSEVNEYFKNQINSDCLSNVDSISVNNFIDENEFKISSAGLSLINTESVDSFIVLNLKNIIIKEFKEKFNSPIRKTDIFFNRPFHLKIDWEINLPQGHSLYTENENKTILGPGHCNSKISYSMDEKKINVSFIMAFPDKYILKNQYNSLIKFIDSSLIELGKDIVIKRI